MRTTMKDIAKACNVSVATVSIALSGSVKKGRISESRLEEIRQTARRLNYFPNSSASNLARGRSQAIGVVMNDIRNSHIAAVDMAISEVLQERGYSVVNHIFNDKNEGKLDELIRRIASENLCALVWAKSLEPEKMEENELLYQTVDSLGIPVITMDGYEFRSDGLNICFDYEKAGYEATSYLLGCGHKRIGCIAGNP